MLTEKKIGWIGTGLMGKPMAEHLRNAGYSVNIYSRTKSKSEELITKGCTWYNSPELLAADSDIIFTMIGFPTDVEEVYFGENGIFKAVKKGSILVDMTTTKPSIAIAIAAEASKHDVEFVDAPVSGGQVGAINATLSIMAGGKRETIEKISPLLEVFGKNIVYQGDAGSGQHTKMCNQIVIAGTMIGVCESLLYGYRANLNLDTMLQSISKGAAGCWTLDVLAPKIVKNDFDPGFRVDHFVKDLSIAIEESEAMQLSLPGLSLAKKLYQILIEMGNEALGTQALFLALKKLSA